jgi:hypothetical protein
MKVEGARMGFANGSLGGAVVVHTVLDDAVRMKRAGTAMKRGKWRISTKTKDDAATQRILSLRLLHKGTVNDRRVTDRPSQLK